MSEEELKGKKRHAGHRARKLTAAIKEMRRQAGESRRAFRRRRRKVARARNKWRRRFLYLRHLLHLIREHRFQPWMANGHPYTHLSAGTRRFIARATAANMVVTATTDGGHATGSFHYERNNPDGKGHAADVASWSVTLMRRFHASEMKHRPGLYKELLGPAFGYIKFKVRLPGYFPDHGDHVHGAPYA